jgi:SAM-dependent methyltransferase
MGRRITVFIMAHNVRSRIRSILRPRPPSTGATTPATGIYLKRKLIADRSISGSGIEIGPLQAPLQVPPGTSVKYVDVLPAEQLRLAFPELEGIVDIDVIDNGERLEKFADGSQQFVIANHVLEHCEDPIGAMKNFFRVLRKGGILYMAIPDKRYTFDRDRRLTPLGHLVTDHEAGPDASLREHYRDWCANVVKSDPAVVEQQADDLVKGRPNIHFHVWTQAELFELMAYLHRNVGFELEEFAANELECIFVLRKA